MIPQAGSLSKVTVGPTSYTSRQASQGSCRAVLLQPRGSTVHPRMTPSTYAPRDPSPQAAIGVWRAKRLGANTCHSQLWSHHPHWRNGSSSWCRKRAACCPTTQAVASGRGSSNWGPRDEESAGQPLSDAATEVPGSRAARLKGIPSVVAAGISVPSTTTAAAAASSPSGASSAADASVPPAALGSHLSLAEWLGAFWRFTRPHTMIGSTLSIISVSLLGLPLASRSIPVEAAVTGILQALIPALCMNIYIVGLNQLFDIEIDKVNKPDLPLASGEFSVRTGVAIVSVAAGISVGLGLLANSPPLLSTLLISMVLGTAYSIDLPGLRWKRSPVLAAACILAVRAVVVQLGFFMHIQGSVLQQYQAVLTVPLVFATSFMCLFSIVIALFKDIPDVEGDREYGILSLSVRLGQQKVYWICISILLLAYTAAVGVSLQSRILWSKILSVAGHVAAGTVLWLRAQKVDFSRASLTDMYMFVWKLFYAEYLLLPLLRF